MNAFFVFRFKQAKLDSQGSSDENIFYINMRNKKNCMLPIFTFRTYTM